MNTIRVSNCLLACIIAILVNSCVSHKRESDGAIDQPKLGQKLAITPFVDVTITQTLSMKCVNAKSGAEFPVSQPLIYPAKITCNGYQTTDRSMDQEIEISSDKTVLFKINDLSTHLAYANANMFRVQMGTVSEGPCAGDSFTWIMSYLPDDLDGCTSSKGVSRYTVNYAISHVKGSKCSVDCTLDNGYITLNPAINNNGAVA